MPWQAELPFVLDNPTPGEASRTIALGDRIVPYTLRRARRRTIGLTIDHRGLRVGAPHRAPLAEIESLIRKHGDWVAQKLDEWRSRRRPESIRIVDGMQLPYLDASLSLRLSTGPNRAFWSMREPVTLTLALRSPADAGRVLEAALRERALEVFDKRVTHFISAFNVAPPRLSLSSARTRWGSCSLRSGIRLNWRLIHFPVRIIDYVVVHELAHLREMNHGPRFWAIVESHLPEYRSVRQELQNLAATRPIW